MRRSNRFTRSAVNLRFVPDSQERVLISRNENLEREAENGVRFRRRTTSLKGRRQTERRRATVPALYKLNVTLPSRKNLLQKIGSRLSKLGDELAKRHGYKSSQISSIVCPNEAYSLKIYAKQLAEAGDYLNAIYSTDSSLVYDDSYCATLAENCVLLTSILIGLKNNNIVTVTKNDLDTLSSLCKVHKVKSLSRTRR